jgi:hypothetical protein
VGPDVNENVGLPPRVKSLAVIALAAVAVGSVWLMVTVWVELHPTGTSLNVRLLAETVAAGGGGRAAAGATKASPPRRRLDPPMRTAARLIRKPRRRLRPFDEELSDIFCRFPFRALAARVKEVQPVLCRK